MEADLRGGLPEEAWQGRGAAGSRRGVAICTIVWDVQPQDSHPQNPTYVARKIFLLAAEGTVATHVSPWQKSISVRQDACDATMPAC